MKKLMSNTSAYGALLCALGLFAFGLYALGVEIDSAQAEFAAQTQPTATPRPTLVHTESGCRFVANDLELMKAMWRHRGLPFPTTPDAARRYFFDDEGVGISADWSITYIYGGARRPFAPAKVGEAGFDEYKRAFQYALSDARTNLVSMAQPYGTQARFPLSYARSGFSYSHADWWLLDIGRVYNTDHVAHIREGFTPVCYHLDTHPERHEVVIATPTVTPQPASTPTATPTASPSPTPTATPES